MCIVQLQTLLVSPKLRTKRCFETHLQRSYFRELQQGLTSQQCYKNKVIFHGVF